MCATAAPYMQKLITCHDQMGYIHSLKNWSQISGRYTKKESEFHFPQCFPQVFWSHATYPTLAEIPGGTVLCPAHRLRNVLSICDPVPILLPCVRFVSAEEVRTHSRSFSTAGANVWGIAEKSVLLFDGITSYNYLAEQKNCEKVSLVGHESYNKVYHLNTVNSLHSRFKEMMRKLRGVASRYLNRYAALFSLIAMTVEHSVTEAADHLRRSLRSLRLPVTIESVKSWNIHAI